MSLIDGELFRKKFFALDIEFRPSQIDAVFDCLGDSEIVESSVSCENASEITRKSNASGDLISREDTYKVLTDYYHHKTEVQHKGLKDALDRVPSAEQPSGDLISREDAIDTIEHYIDEVRNIPMGTSFKAGVKDGYYRTISIIKRLPSAEPQIIRCKDCKHLIDHRCYHWRSLSDWRNDNDYCSRAERREEE